MDPDTLIRYKVMDREEFRQDTAVQNITTGVPLTMPVASVILFMKTVLNPEGWDRSYPVAYRHVAFCLTAIV